MSTTESAARSAEVEGPWRFRLRRVADPSGVSGTGVVADGVRFRDRTCVLRWKTKDASTAVYETHDALMRIHGHDGATVCEWVDEPPTEGFEHGSFNCLQDAMENCPFAGIGGLDARSAPKVPEYVRRENRAEWLRGYIATARAMYGEDWATCAFGWQPAITIGAREESATA